MTTQILSDSASEICSSWYFWTFFAIVFLVSFAFVFTEGRIVQSLKYDKELVHSIRLFLRLYHNIIIFAFSIISACFLPIIYKGPGRLEAFITVCCYVPFMLFIVLLNPLTLCRYSFPFLPSISSCIIAMDILWDFIADLVTAAAIFGVYYHIINNPVFLFYYTQEKGVYNSSVFLSLTLWVPMFSVVGIAIVRTIYRLVILSKDYTKSVYSYDLKKEDSIKQAKSFIIKVKQYEKGEKLQKKVPVLPIPNVKANKWID